MNLFQSYKYTGAVLKIATRLCDISQVSKYTDLLWKA